MSMRFATLILNSYAYIPGALLSAAPITISAWVRPTSVANLTEILSICSADSGNYFSLRLNANQIQAVARSNTSRTATSTQVLSTNTWYHVCAVFASSSSRAAYVNGGNKGTNTQSSTPSVVGGETTLAGLGGSSNGDYYSGDIAELAIWNVALSDAQVLMLSLGLEPTFVAPSNIAAYLPLLNHSSGFDGTLEGGYLMDLRRSTNNGWRVINGLLVSRQAHPRMIYSKRQIISCPPSPFQAAWGMQAGNVQAFGSGLYVM